MIKDIHGIRSPEWADAHLENEASDHAEAEYFREKALAEADQWAREVMNLRVPTDFGGALAAHKSAGKPQVGDLDWAFIEEMGKVMTGGLTKYPNDPDGMPNWWKGGDYRGFLASMGRHLIALAKGEDIDPEFGAAHAAHLAVDAMFLWSWQTRGVGQDRRLSR